MASTVKNSEARETVEIPGLAKVIAAFAQHAAPSGLGRLAAQTRKLRAGGGEDRATRPRVAVTMRGA